jgi:ATP-dependent protease ClpP protease subunit
MGTTQAFANYQFRGVNYTLSYTETTDEQIISLRGQILSGIVEDLTGLNEVRKMIKPGKDILLKLNSGGGFQVKFNQLSKAIKKACYPRGEESKQCEITTEVTSMCASACIPLFMVGDTRQAGRYANFGFHQAAVVPGALRIPGMAQRDLRKNGVNDEWLKANDHLFASLQITWLRPGELNGSDIVTNFLP